MLKDIYNLSFQYFREYWLRDLLIVLGFATLVPIVYLLTFDNVGASLLSPTDMYTDRALMTMFHLISKGLGFARNAVVYAWIVAIALYSLLTLFNSYGDTRRSYTTLLLPSRTFAKFIWEISRTLILFSLFTLGLWYVADLVIINTFIGNYPNPAEFIDRLKPFHESIFATSEPLNYIPCVLYALVWCHCIAMIAKSGIHRVMAVTIALVGFALALIGPFGHYPFVEIDYVYDKGVYWRSVISWSSRSTGYVISYIWYLGLPMGIYIWNYFKLKERRMV